MLDVAHPAAIDEREELIELRFFLRAWEAARPGGTGRPSHTDLGDVDTGLPDGGPVSPDFRGSYVLWITIAPPAIACGSAVSMSVGWPFRLSKTTLPLFVLVIRIRNLSTPPPPVISPSYAVSVKS